MTTGPTTCTLAYSDVRCEANTLLRRFPADRVITGYPAEVPRLGRELRRGDGDG